MQTKKQVTVRSGVTTIQSSILIDAPKTKVWEILRLPGNIADFHPLVKKSAKRMAPHTSLYELND